MNKTKGAKIASFASLISSLLKLGSKYQQHPQLQFRMMEAGSPIAWELRRLIYNYWDEAAQHFAETQCETHIYRSMISLERWLDGAGPIQGEDLHAMCLKPITEMARV